MPLGLAADQKGILPDRMIAALAKAGGILPAYDFAPDQIQPASLDLRLGDIAYRVRASFLPGHTHGRGAHRASEAARDRARRRRGAGDRLRLHRAADRKPRAAGRHRGRRQSEKLDRPARRVHARDHRPRARLRPHRGGLSRAALCGDLAEDVSRAGARGLAAFAASAAPRPRDARRRRSRGAACARAAGRFRRRGFRRRHFGRRRSRGLRRERADRLSRQAPHRRDRCRAPRRLRLRRLLGADARARRRER